MKRRQFLSTSLATAGYFLSSSTFGQPSRHVSANDSINVGMISCGGRAGGLAKQFAQVNGVNIAGLCDPDSSRVANLKSQFPKAQTWSDLRALLDSESIDAVVVATCNHWHCLAAIWAMEAGKDVYVEKPLSHSQWEGEQTVAAARSLDKICQLGTQQRSDPMQAKIKKFLHEDKALGAIKSCRVNRYGIRPSIGKRDTPLPIDKNVAYDLWLGPAQDQPIFRKSLHYDWHWDWNTGSGEMGNWGVHVLDDVRNVVFQDSVSVPKRIFGGGGRVVWNDAGQTPNVHFVYFDTGAIPVVIGLSNLPDKPGSKKAAPHPGPASGYVVYCEGGEYHGYRGGGVALDNDGKEIKKFKGNKGDVAHQSNFVEAVRKRDRSILNSEVEVGHDSTGWCNLANIAYRCGGQMNLEQAESLNVPEWKAVVAETKAHVEAHDLKLDGSQFKLSPVLELDVESQRFTGENAEAANKFIKREYRKPYVVPDYAKVNS